MTLEWTCAGCGIPSPDRKRSCDCATNVVCSGSKQEWKASGEDDMRLAITAWLKCPADKRPSPAALGQRIADIAASLPRS
jgi:hypothetical protein